MSVPDIGRQKCKKAAAKENISGQMNIVRGRGYGRYWNKLRRCINKRILRKEMRES